MSRFRIALANLRFPQTAEESIVRACDTVHRASLQGARMVCFPECYVPGYRAADRALPAPDAGFLDAAWHRIAAAAAEARIGVVLGTERATAGLPVASALVVSADGTLAGFQDKVQLDPSEDAIYEPGTTRQIFRVGELTFGIAICHEGWRYPETVRWAAQRGAQLVVHPQMHEAEPGGYRPTGFADPRNSFHEKALLCRAAENTCYIASVNYASPGSPTTSAVVNPDGTLLAFQPYGREGLLVADLELELATGLLARRLRNYEG